MAGCRGLLIGLLRRLRFMLHMRIDFLWRNLRVDVEAEETVSFSDG